MWFWNFIENPSQTRPIPIVANRQDPVSDLADRQSTRHSLSEGQACWVPEGSGQAVPTTEPAPIYYRGMLSYCPTFLFFILGLRVANNIHYNCQSDFRIGPHLR